MPNELSRTSHRLRLIGVASFTLLIVVIGLNSMGVMRRNADTRRSVEHTHEVLAKIDGLLEQLTTAETGERGFVMTGSDEHLLGYNAAAGRILQLLGRIEALTADNPEQQRNAARLRRAAEAMLLELGEIIRLRRNESAEVAFAVATDRAQHLMIDVRVCLAEMRAEENALLQLREARNHESTAVLEAISYVLLAVALLLVGIITWMLTWIRRLQTSLITICAWTRDVRWQGKWVPLEQYLHERFGINVSHGMSQKVTDQMLREIETRAEKRAAHSSELTEIASGI